MALRGALPLGKMKMGERKKRIGKFAAAGAVTRRRWTIERGCAYFVLSLARSNVTVSVSVSPLRETVSVALSPAE